eukprot:TRINITY_DN33690_c0_g1_i1.p1 TRINITY_DN33690_c0_g1~~TRINITY_DN33690_c0_g1_i1.p1  ORF type:complete len:282 (+),score=44.97 TRINITY_DN33690_c0_g1_i1:41-847(+)
MVVHVKLAAFFVIAVLAWVLQVVALASPSGFTRDKCGGCGNGLFGSTCWGGFQNDRCSDRRGLMKAAAGFGVVAAVLMGLEAVFHGLLVFKIDAISRSTYGYMAVIYLWMPHAVTAAALTLAWALLAALFDRTFCSTRLKSSSDLNFGFVVLIFNTAIEASLALACYKGLHQPPYMEVPCAPDDRHAKTLDMSTNPIERSLGRTVTGTGLLGTTHTRRSCGVGNSTIPPYDTYSGTAPDEQHSNTPADEVIDTLPHERIEADKRHIVY